MGSKNLHNNLQGYAFMAPAMLVIGVFTLLPIIFAFLMMFCKVDLMAGSWKFIGLDNAGKIFSDVKFWHAFWNTTRYVVVVVPTQTILAMILAVLLNNKVKFQRGFATLLFIPSLTSSAAMTLIFMWLFNNNSGLITQFINNLTGQEYKFLSDPQLALGVIMAMNIFSTIPSFMVVFLAGLQDIGEEIYEAAAIDGCGQVRKFISITMPQLMPVTFYVVTMGIIGCFQIFDQAFILSGGDGGPQNSTLTFTLYIYQLAFNSSDMGRASMIAFILAIIIFSVSHGIDKVFNADKVNG